MIIIELEDNWLTLIISFQRFISRGHMDCIILL